MSAERIADHVAGAVLREDTAPDTQRWVVRLAGQVGWREARRLVLARVRAGCA